MTPVSIRKAIAVGTIFVNGPVLPFMFTPLVIFVFTLGDADKQHATPMLLLQITGYFLIGFVIAWLWWSITVPRWRLWAWQRVGDLAGLKRQAVDAGLIWPDGHFFERTELRSKAIQAKLKEIESEKLPRD